MKVCNAKSVLYLFLWASEDFCLWASDFNAPLVTCLAFLQHYRPGGEKKRCSEREKCFNSRKISIYSMELVRFSHARQIGFGDDVGKYYLRM